MVEMDPPSGFALRRLLNPAIRTAQRTLAVFGLLLLVVTLTPLDTWWATQLAGAWNDPKGEVLIVPGGSALEDGTLGGSSYWRAVYAARAWREGGFKAIVLTGGGPPAGSVAESMRDFLVAQGVPRESMRFETRSQSTRENALFTKPILYGMPGRKVLLTSDYHMYRARRAFQNAGLDFLPPFFRMRASTLRAPFTVGTHSWISRKKRPRSLATACAAGPETLAAECAECPKRACIRGDQKLPASYRSVRFSRATLHLEEDSH